MPEAEQEQKFQRYLESTAQYNAAITDAGDEPWWLSEAKLAKLERSLPGISAMEPEERRAALYHHHHNQKQARRGIPA